MDEAHETLSGPATQKILQREFYDFGDQRCERLARLCDRAGDWARRLLPFGHRRGDDGRDTGLALDLSPAARVGVWRYRPRPFHGRIAAFAAAGTPTWPRHDRRLVWRRVALGGWEVHSVPGDHESALAEPHVSESAAKLLE